MTLTRSEKRILERVSRPTWPKFTLYLLIVIVACGVVSLVLAITGCVRLARTAAGPIPEPNYVKAWQECWLALLIASTALISSIFAWATRSYGLLIRKLRQQNNGTQP